MRRKILTIALILGVVAAVYYFIEIPLSEKYLLTIRGASLEVELANTEYLATKGLMGRQYLPENEGMLFLFPFSAHRVFHMKNTFIPLSIAFIREDGTIAQILDMRPGINEIAEAERYRSNEKVRYALEVNQGWFKRNNISVGDKAHFSRSIKKNLDRIPFSF